MGRRLTAALWLLPPLCHAQTPPPEPVELGVKFSTTVTESLFGTTTVRTSGLRGEIYYLEPETFSLPKFEKLKPVGTVYTNGLNIAPRNFDEGFPGVTDRFEWFAIDYTGKFYIAKAGKYEFVLVSDDGSKLYIDGRTVIDLNGHHPPERGTSAVKLTAGMHNIRVSYFQGPRYQIALMLGVRPPGGREWKIFNTDEYQPPANPDDGYGAK
jgi:hypothetical protein